MSVILSALLLLGPNLIAMAALISGRRRRAAAGDPAGPGALVPLSSRLATAVLGWCLGGLTTLLGAPVGIGTLIGQAVLALPLILLALPSPWGFRFAAAGANWERRHWVAYAISNVSILLALLLVPGADAGAPAIAFAAGIAVTLPLIAVAFLRPLTMPDHD